MSSKEYKFELGKKYLIKELTGYLSEFGYKVGDIVDTGLTCGGCPFALDPDGDLRLENGDEGWKYGRPFLYCISLEDGYTVLLEDDGNITPETSLPYLHDQSYSAMDMTFSRGCAFWHVISSHKNVDNKERALRDMKLAIWHLEQEVLRVESSLTGYTSTTGETK